MALAACAALALGVFSIHSYCQNGGQWMFFVRSFHRGPSEISVPMHSYVTVEGLTGYAAEDAPEEDTASYDPGR